MQNKISVQAKLGQLPYRVDLSNGRHMLNADEPTDKGGGDSAPTPDELVAMALSACTSITLRMYSERKQWNLGEIVVETSSMRMEDGTQIFERTISFENSLEESIKERLLSVANKCPVHKTLSAGHTINSIIKS